jgi:cell division protein FtsL
VSGPVAPNRRDAEGSPSERSRAERDPRAPQGRSERSQAERNPRAPHGGSEPSQADRDPRARQGRSERPQRPPRARIDASAIAPQGGSEQSQADRDPRAQQGRSERPQRPPRARIDASAIAPQRAPRARIDAGALAYADAAILAPQPFPAPRAITAPRRLTARGPVARPQRLAYGGVAIASRVAGVAVDVSASRLMDRLVRGRVWIGVVAFCLIGLVATQVSLLKLNSGIGRAVQTASTLERSNSSLRAEISRLSAGDRIQRLAAAGGMVMPAPADVTYLRARRDRGAAERAAQRTHAPDPNVPPGPAGAPTQTAVALTPAAPGVAPATDPAAQAPPAGATTAPAGTAPAGTAPAGTAPTGTAPATTTPPPATPVATPPVATRPAVTGAAVPTGAPSGGAAPQATTTVP